MDGGFSRTVFWFLWPAFPFYAGAGRSLSLVNRENCRSCQEQRPSFGPFQLDVDNEKAVRGACQRLTTRHHNPSHVTTAKFYDWYRNIRVTEFLKI
jgi:hypothetical protein